MQDIYTPLAVAHVRYELLFFFFTGMIQVFCLWRSTHSPNLSSRAHLVSRGFYSCCLLLFPGISQWILSQGADEPAQRQHLVGKGPVLQ